MLEALLVNFGIASSIAAFPVTLKCLTAKNGVNEGVGKLLLLHVGPPPQLAGLILPIAVLINLASYPLTGLLYVASLEGLPLSAGQVAMAALILTVLAYGTSGIPQDSFMTILLVCGMFGVPTTSMATVLAVDWIIDRVDSIAKTMTDATAVAVVAHFSAAPSDCPVATNL